MNPRYRPAINISLCYCPSSRYYFQEHVIQSRRNPLFAALPSRYSPLLSFMSPPSSRSRPFITLICPHSSLPSSFLSPLLIPLSAPHSSLRSSFLSPLLIPLSPHSSLRSSFLSPLIHLSAPHSPLLITDLLSRSEPTMPFTFLNATPWCMNSKKSLAFLLIPLHMSAGAAAAAARTCSLRANGTVAAGSGARSSFATAAASFPSARGTAVSCSRCVLLTLFACARRSIPLRHARSSVLLERSGSNGAVERAAGARGATVVRGAPGGRGAVDVALPGTPFPVLLACSVRGTQAELSRSCGSRRIGTVAWARGRGRAVKKEELAWGSAEAVTAEEEAVGGATSGEAVDGVTVGNVAREKTVTEVTVGDVNAEREAVGEVNAEQEAVGEVCSKETVEGVTLRDVSAEQTVEEVTVGDVSEESGSCTETEGSRASEVTVWKEEAQVMMAGQGASELSVWKEESKAAGRKASELTVWKQESKAVVAGRKASELTVWKEEGKAVVAGQKALEVTVWKEEAKTAIIEKKALEEAQAAVIGQRGLEEHPMAVIQQRASELIVWEEEAEAPVVIDQRALEKHEAAVSFEAPEKDEHEAAVEEASIGLDDPDPEEVFEWTHTPRSAFQLFESTQRSRAAEAALVGEQQQGIQDPSELSQTWSGGQQPWQLQQKQQEMKEQWQGHGEQQEQKVGAEVTAFDMSEQGGNKGGAGAAASDVSEQQEQKGGAEATTVFDMSELVQAVAFEAASDFSNAQGFRCSFHQYLESLHERMTRQQLNASLEVQQVVGWAGVNYDMLLPHVRRQRLDPISRALGYSDTQHLLEHYTAVDAAMSGLDGFGHSGGEESVSFESTQNTQHLQEHHRAVDAAMSGLDSEGIWEHIREESMGSELTQNAQHLLEHHHRATVEAVGWESEEMVGHSGGESVELAALSPRLSPFPSLTASSPHVSSHVRQADAARHDVPGGAVRGGGDMHSDSVGAGRQGPRESDLEAAGEAHSSVQQRFDTAQSSNNPAAEEPNGSQTGASLPFESSSGSSQSRNLHSSAQQSAGTQFGSPQSNVEPHRRSQTGAEPLSPQRSQSTPTSLSSPSPPAAYPARSARSVSSAPPADSAPVQSEWQRRANAMRAAAALARAATPATTTTPSTTATSPTTPATSATPHPSSHLPVPPSVHPSSAAPASPPSAAPPTSLSSHPNPPHSHPQAPSSPSWPADTHRPWSRCDHRGSSAQHETPRVSTTTERQDAIRVSRLFESTETEQETPLVSTTTVRQDVVRASSVGQGAGHVIAQQVDWSSVREGHRVGRHSEADSATHPAVAALLARWCQTHFASVCFEDRPELKLPGLVRDAAGSEAREGGPGVVDPVRGVEEGGMGEEGGGVSGLKGFGVVDLEDDELVEGGEDGEEVEEEEGEEEEGGYEDLDAVGSEEKEEFLDAFLQEEGLGFRMVVEEEEEERSDVAVVAVEAWAAGSMATGTSTDTAKRGRRKKSNEATGRRQEGRGAATGVADDENVLAVGEMGASQWVGVGPVMAISEGGAVAWDAAAGTSVAPRVGSAAEKAEEKELVGGLDTPLAGSTEGGGAAADGDAADRAAAEMAWLDTTLGSRDGAAEAPASHAGRAAIEEHVSWLETPLRSLARRSGGVLTPGQREKLEKAGMWTVRHLLEHYPHTYKDLTRSREDVMRDGQVAAVGVVESVSVNAARGGSCAVAELRIRCNPPDNAATTGNTNSPTSTTTSGPRFSIPRSTSSSGSSGNSGGGFMVTAKQFRAGSWARKALYSAYPKGCLVSVTGQMRTVHGDGTIELDMNSDIVKVDAGASRGDGGAVPVYSARKDMDPLSLRVILESLVKMIPPDLEYHSPSLRARCNLLPLPLALATIHCPSDRALVPLARRRIVFDEFFFYQLRILLQSRRIKLGHLASAAAAAAAASGGGGGTIEWTRRDLTAEQWSPLTQEILSSLPYTLTAGQMQAAREIISDMNWPVPMSRLLQGDVGCGKTVVALLACMEAVAHGYQVAVMAPTQFLAQQHVARFEQWLQALPPDRRPRVCLLTGSVKRAKALRLDIKEGRVSIIIGTHALIARATAFHRLGLAIVDEQHRFGVKQRARLHEKGLDALRQQQEAIDSSDTEDAIESGNIASAPSALPLLSEPHTLTMTATPIPRSLALVLHGQTDISRIAELPPGRTPVETLVFYDGDGKGGSSGEESEGEWEEEGGEEKERAAAYKILREEVQSGGRAFIVFPIIDASEELPEVRAATEEFQLLTEPGGLLGRALRDGSSSAAARAERAAAQKDRPRRRSDYSRFELCEIDNFPDGYETDQYNCELDAMYGPQSDDEDYSSDEEDEEEDEEEEEDDEDDDGDDGYGSDGAAVLRCGLVHGRMEPEEKEGVMRSFQEGSIQVLVCTTVIEVGIDIPEATVMLVEHAERYGLAQLHQLRGRVGRGQRPSRCLLVGSSKGARHKLKLLESTHDGLVLAQLDLKMRGPGELLGSKQSGRLPGFNLARLDRDVDILNEAMQAAE
ncbi:unnamed protein product, partial [Closterium sp. Naga37s-1]